MVAFVPLLDIDEAETYYKAHYHDGYEYEDDGTRFGRPVDGVGDRWRALLQAWADANGVKLGEPMA